MNNSYPPWPHKGKTIVAVTHDERYFHVAHRVVKMEFGRIVGIDGHIDGREALTRTRLHERGMRMVAAGIEAMNVFGGSASVDVMELAQHRRLDRARVENLLMRQKAVALPYEDAITYGVNAARPLLDTLADAEKDRIEMLITCSESGIDFGKSISTYIHHYLGLNRNCRLFELKQACYAGTAGFQMAVNFILAQTSPGPKRW